MRDDTQRDPGPSGAEQPGDGPPADGNRGIPTSSPPEENSQNRRNPLELLAHGAGVPAPAHCVVSPVLSGRDAGLKPRGRVITRAEFAQKHTNVRQVPKPPGWQPYRSGAMFSREDVLQIRASMDDHVTLAAMYGCGRGTIQKLRAFKQGRVLSRWNPGKRLLELDLPVAELARMLTEDFNRLQDKYRRPLAVAMAKERRARGRLTRVERRKAKEAGGHG